MSFEMTSQWKALRQQYRVGLGRHREQLQSAWGGESAPSSAALDVMANIAHRLCGSGQAYGFSEISRLARQLELGVNELKSEPSKDRASFDQLVQALLACLQQYEIIADDGNTREPAWLPRKSQDAHRILLVDDDCDFARHLESVLRHEGFEVAVLLDIAELGPTVAAQRPLAAVIDMDFSGERFAGAEEVLRMQPGDGPPLPVIFVSAFDSFDLRLAAIRAGGHYFFGKPLEESSLVDTLRTLLGLQDADPFRILLVDDDTTLLALYRDVLEEAGYKVFTATHGREALTLLEKQEPDLALIDVHMPGCTGIELGQILRQHHQFAHMPILFMSASLDTDLQLACVRLAHDEFIHKPIEPWRLLMAVEPRAKRSRLLRPGARSGGFSFDLEYDALTALPNLRQFRKELEQALIQQRHSGELVTAIKIDLRDFHAVNDVYGHHFADQLLQKIAWDISHCLSAQDVLCRDGGDEFWVLTTQLKQPEQADDLACAVLHAIERSKLTETGAPLHLAANIGIAMAPQDALSQDELLQCTETALFHAKQHAGSHFSYFSPALQQQQQTRFLLDQDLQKALVFGEFCAYFQPIFTVQSGELQGFEALARWRHPSRGLLAPGLFVEPLEKRGLLSRLTLYMLQQSIMQLQCWRQRHPHIFVSLNLSASDLQSPSQLDQLRRIIEAAALPPGALIVELTESVLMQDWDTASAALAALREVGVQLAIDDFGTGYCSLSYLTRLNAVKLKIDRSFIQSWSQARDDRLIRAIIQLGRSLSMQIVAEGVEHAEQLEFLSVMGCDEYQGYYVSRPKPALELEIAPWFVAGRYRALQAMDDL